MKRINLISMALSMLIILTVACSKSDEGDGENKKENLVVNFDLDTNSNLKNPYMGWTLYSEGNNNIDRPSTYWYMQDEAARDYAGVYYIRWRWSDLEPEEGVYAWDNNDDFKGLIQGALDRNLRLAFRIYVNGQDNLIPSTPQYVLDGAETYDVHFGASVRKTPYADDEFFLEKYIKFIEAFGKKFNDPSTVDYVDSYGLGWWGEGHNIKYKNISNKYDSHNSIVRAYANAFNKVINVINFGVRDENQQAVVYDELGFSPRRDGYVSKWFPVSQQNDLVSYFPQTPIIAEAAYWGPTVISSVEGGKWNTWSEYHREVVDLALKTKANYLDLRSIAETTRYLEDSKSEVERFITKGGYRIYPKQIICTTEPEKMTLEHTWLNSANGVLPNNNINLGHKYKVAFALFDVENNLVKKWISDNIEVSELVNQKEITATSEFDLSDLGDKEYKLGVAIINTRENDSKDISLAIDNAQIIKNEWVFVTNIAIG